MSYELTGTITHIFDAMEFESGFKKREFVVKTDDKYPQDVKFEMVKNKNAEKDMTNVLDKYAVGQKVNVSFDIRGNAYNDRFYVKPVMLENQRGRHRKTPSPRRSRTSRKAIHLFDMLTLRQYQRTAVKSAVVHFAFNQRGLLVSPAGSGKTVIAASILKEVKAGKTLLAGSHCRD
jgi:ATP-dependent protease Clp ATPase subunit